MSLNDGILGLSYTPTPSGNIHYSFQNNPAFPGLMQLHAEVSAAAAPNGFANDTNVNISMPAENKILASGTVIDVHEGAMYWDNDTKQAYPLPKVELYTNIVNGTPASGIDQAAWPFTYQANQNITN